MGLFQQAMDLLEKTTSLHISSSERHRYLDYINLLKKFGEIHHMNSGECTERYVKTGRYFEDYHWGLWFWRNENKIDHHLERLRESEQAILLENNDIGIKSGESSSTIMEEIDNDDVCKKGWCI
ncbi:unnamed protein product [Lupinus luteus]|uniref:Uncharacterized protein n=1 Tax=Lupinus luteus TaxID=3873 RepID=A0AAV1YI20_LUPLU